MTTSCVIACALTAPLAPKPTERDRSRVAVVFIPHGGLRTSARKLFFVAASASVLKTGSRSHPGQAMPEAVPVQGCAGDLLRPVRYVRVTFCELRSLTE